MPKSRKVDGKKGHGKNRQPDQIANINFKINVASLQR